METLIVALMIITVALASVNYRKIWMAVSKIRMSIALERSASIFDNDYVNGKTFFLYRFRKVPNTTFVSCIDVNKVFDHITESLSGEIADVFQSNSFNRETGMQEFDKTIFVLKDNMIITLYYQYATILFTQKNTEKVNSLVIAISEYKIPEKKEDFEINIIIKGEYGLGLKQMPINPTELDINLFYNDDFKSVDKVIKERLTKENDKGIVLLHGLPGTGKTTYLRHLVGSMKKKVLFVSPSVAGNLMDPDFIDLLIDNPNSILVIEDAENIMMDRKFNSNSSVSNLLNVSDGLLSDCMNVQVICTFNSDLNLIDPALMRKGRLIARYEFGKLTAKKAQALSRKLGFANTVNQPMTLAEIANQHEASGERKSVEVMGFRRQEPAMN